MGKWEKGANVGSLLDMSKTSNNAGKIKQMLKNLLYLVWGATAQSMFYFGLY